MNIAKKTNDTKNKMLIISLFLVLASVFCFSQKSYAATKKTTLKTSSASIYVNGTYTISLKNKLKDATYFYTSNKTSIAKVSAKGVITGRGKGTAKINVRYKYKDTFKSVGTFKVTVSKSALKKDYTKVTATVGDVLKPSDYLNSVNDSAEYEITSSSSQVVSVATNGAITCLKAGTTSLTLHEVYNKKSRKIGNIELTVIGASLRTDYFKIAYLNTLSLDKIVENKDEDAIYTFTSDSTDIARYLDLSSSGIISTVTGNSVQLFNITLVEIKTTGETRNIGTFKLELTNEPFIAEADQSIKIGLGATLSLSDYEGINITNQRSGATYSFKPKDTSIISNDMVATKYGTTTVEIEETYLNRVTTLDETVQVTVTTSSIKKELSLGYTTMVDGDIYGDYPVDCRDHTKTYYYEAENTSICTVTTGGTNKDQDYLVISPLKVGITSISVFETVPGTSRKERVGNFKVTVKEDTSELPDITKLKASDIIRSISFTHNDKTVTGIVSSTNLMCNFYDNTGGLIDYGTKYSDITRGNFTMILKKSKYLITNVETNNGGSIWTFTIDLGDSSHTLVNVPVVLVSSRLDPSTFIDNIVVKLGTTTNKITSISATDTTFTTQFTAAQYVAAGATEYSSNYATKVPLSSLTNVTCIVNQKTYNSINTPTANAAVTKISTPVTSNNKTWSFTVEFEDGTKQAYTVVLGLK
ncbi:hypothetical protein KQI69_01215 [Eubacterium sp. MSJ-13]|uniref:hypothetical protein n=1 Tax=Eubacterium sp. MSJ-13 TaxID=2841513 RepID=UPI001C10C4AA|nr:hypothetical protein [Eubacterium sp. MSJ-13]MBU5477819.1 hypothetical protein [Eubacterium sp. MSJ-13]